MFTVSISTIASTGVFFVTFGTNGVINLLLNFREMFVVKQFRWYKLTMHERQVEECVPLVLDYLYIALLFRISMYRRDVSFMQ